MFCDSPYWLYMCVLTNYIYIYTYIMCLLSVTKSVLRTKNSLVNFSSSTHLMRSVWFIKKNYIIVNNSLILSYKCFCVCNCCFISLRHILIIHKFFIGKFAIMSIHLENQIMCWMFVICNKYRFLAECFILNWIFVFLFYVRFKLRFNTILSIDI